MIYSDTHIEQLIEDGRIKFSYKGAVNPASLNVRLGTTFLTPKYAREPIELGDNVQYEKWSAKIGDKVLIEPGEFMLATTMEWIDISDYKTIDEKTNEWTPDLAAFVQGRSSMGRIGLSVQNAGFVDPGFRGNITLELKNDGPNPIGLIVGYPVAQLVFMESEPVSHEYAGKYLDQVDATGSRMNEDDMKSFGLKRSA